jgi:hypothetical protein
MNKIVFFSFDKKNMFFHFYNINSLLFSKNEKKVEKKKEENFF